MTEAVFFATADELREWFAGNAATASELVVGFHRVGSGIPSLTWPEAVDEALCVGWIDGVRRRIDETSYSNRFTPRRAGSTWSAINIKRVGELQESGRMQPSGIAVFEARDGARSAIYSYERPLAALDADADATFRANTVAWAWFSARPPSYRRTAIYWVVSAKRPETRARRLAALIAESEAGRTVGPLTPPRRSGG